MQKVKVNQLNSRNALIQMNVWVVHFLVSACSCFSEVSKENRYEFKVELESTFRLKKASYFCEDWESYEKKLSAFRSGSHKSPFLPNEVPFPPNESQVRRKEEKDQKLKLSYNNRSLELKEGTPEVKKSTVYVWISEETKIKFSEVLPIISSISAGNKVLIEVMKYFETPELSSLFSRGFITKIQIPLAFSIRANIYFNRMEFLSERQVSELGCLLEIPREYKQLSRKQAQKTIQRTKKLVLLGQALL